MLTMMRGIVLKFDDPKEFAEILRTKRIGIYNLGPGIGDHVYHTYFPEVYYKNVGRKVVDLNKKWCYDFNPYVERDQPVDIAICPWGINDRLPKRSMLAVSEFIFKPLGFKIDLRHPRLYKFEDIETIPNRICVHTTGKSSKFSLSDSVIEQIEKNYKGYEIIQIGGKNDKQTPFIDKRGLENIWDTVKIIASSSIFIGVNSGLYHIANAYPRVWKKIVLADTLHTFDDLKDWTPLNPNYKNGFWNDLTTAYFNLSENDVGITYSYRKI